MPRVLIVDDNASVGRALGRALRREHETQIVKSVAEAKTALLEDTFDFVVSDVMMPEASGADLHRWMLAQQPDLVGRFLLVTGGATSELWAYIDRNQVPYLEKPVLPEDLLSHLRQQGCPSPE